MMRKRNESKITYSWTKNEMRATDREMMKNVEKRAWSRNDNQKAARLEDIINCVQCKIRC